ncbi:MAG: hypothetical protein H6659_04755 [Ardenticatenaceae bacterium]|nr:hypothetical protein [Ardenticatenaceae bacterium]
MAATQKNSKYAQIFVLGLILAGMVIYFPPYARAWVGDDYVQLGYILNFVARPFTAFQLFNPTTLGWYYRPLQNLWFLANRLVFGLNPAAFYWQLLLWHALAAALVFRTARQWGIRPFAAACAAALFAVHGHYVDVVAWVSSVAIVMTAVFSLLSLSFYLDYLHRPRNSRLWLSLLFFILALFSHEEAILLPIFFLLLTIFPTAPPQPLTRSPARPATRSPAHRLTLAAMLGLTAVMVIIQFTRPNLTIDISQTSGGQWLSLLSPVKLGQFWSDTAVHYALIYNLKTMMAGNAWLFGWGVLLLLGAWFWAATPAGRWGLVWAALHLSLIYATIWLQKPELFAGRHFYNAAVGLVWAVGAGIDQILAYWPEQKKRRGKRDTAVLVRGGVVLAVTAVLLFHVVQIRRGEVQWLQRTQRDQLAEQEMKAILPTLTPDTHVFANRFPITPQFFRAVTEVWYQQTQRLPLPTGSFTQLQEAGRATSDYYVFDYDNGRVYNLMPELQTSSETVFIWSNDPRLDLVDEAGQVTSLATETAQTNFAIVKSGDGRRFAVQVTPDVETEGWLSLMYIVPEIPAGSDLRLAFRSNVEGETPFRVRLSRLDGQAVTLAEGVFTPEQEWAEVTVPLAAYGGESVIVRLETAVSPPHTAYWANPRLTVNN